MADTVSTTHRPSARRPLARRLRVGALAIPAVVLLAVIFLLPLVKLIGDSVITSTGPSLSRYGDLLTDGIFLQVIWRTVWISTIVTVLTVMLGYPVAYVAARAGKVVSLLLMACVVLPLFTSTLVRSYAWRVLLADNGMINDALLAAGLVDNPIKLLYNDTSIVVGMTQVLLPFAILPILAGLKGIDRSVLNAARSAGASPVTAWRTITLPLSLRGLMAGASLVFITSLGFYTTPALLGGISTPMFAQLVDSQVNNQANYGSTTAAAALVLVGVVLLMFFLRKPLGLVAAAVTTGDVQPMRRRRRLLPSIGWPAGSTMLLRVEDILSPVRWVIVAALASFGALALLAPQIVVAILAFNEASFLSFPPEQYSTRWFGEYFADPNWLDSTLLTARISAMAAIIATLVGTLAAFAVVRMRSLRTGVAIYMLSLAPMVLPPILYAVGLFFIYVQLGLTGTETGLVLAYIAIGIPYVMITSQAVARDIDPLMERAAASMGANGFTRARSVVIPLMIPALFASFLLAFIQVFDDLVLALFLGGAETVTLQMRMYENIQFEISPMVAAVGVMLTAATLLLGLATLSLGRRRARSEPRSR